MDDTVKSILIRQVGVDVEKSCGVVRGCLFIFQNLCERVHYGDEKYKVMFRFRGMKHSPYHSQHSSQHIIS